MNLRKIFAIPGKPGLFELLSQTKTGAIMQSLLDAKRLPVFAADKISSLQEIGIYTTEKDIPLKEVLQSIFKKENGQATSVSPKASPKELLAYFSEILPDFDRDRVYASDIKKLLSWYNLLLSKSLIDLEADADSADPSENAPSEA